MFTEPKPTHIGNYTDLFGNQALSLIQQHGKDIRAKESLSDLGVPQLEVTFGVMDRAVRVTFQGTNPDEFLMVAIDFVPGEYYRNGVFDEAGLTVDMNSPQTMRFLSWVRTFILQFNRNCMIYLIGTDDRRNELYSNLARRIMQDDPTRMINAIDIDVDMLSPGLRQHFDEI
jgi:hypothetical protein